LTPECSANAFQRVCSAARKLPNSSTVAGRGWAPIARIRPANSGSASALPTSELIRSRSARGVPFVAESAIHATASNPG
jgi:hypothetical protein